MTSSHTVHYPYATGKLLDERNSYSYTTYHGAEFLAAWRRQRDAALRMPSAPCASDDIPSCTSPTALLLRDVLAGLAGEPCQRALTTLNRVLQRFEVTKRLHAEYNSNWRPVNAQDYYDLELYLQFAQALDRAYSLTRALQYLNGLLKCLDTLTAYQYELKAHQAQRLHALVHAERRHVETLQMNLDKGMA